MVAGEGLVAVLAVGASVAALEAAVAASVVEERQVAGNETTSRLQAGGGRHESVPAWAQAAISDTDVTRLDQVIASAEKKTSAEIVVVIANQCTSRTHLPVMGALFGALAVLVLEPMIATLPMMHGAHGWLPWWGLAVVGAALGAAATLIPGAARLLIPDSVEIRDVHRSSVLAFQAFGVRRTKDSSGVLIFVSLFERRVEIYGDEAVASKVDAAFWTSHCETLAQAARQARLSGGIEQVITSMSSKLADILPPSPQNSDELCNRVRFWAQF